MLSVCLISLAGLPPTAGFIGKFYLVCTCVVFHIGGGWGDEGGCVYLIGLPKDI